MTSLKKQIDAHTEELLSATARAYHAALVSVGTNAEQAVPGVDFPLSGNLAALQDQLQADPAPATVARTQLAVDSALSQWSDSVERHLRSKAAEFREIMLVMAGAAQNIAARDVRYASRFREITSRLNQIAGLDDLSAVRRSLMTSASELDADVRSMETEGQKTITGLEVTLEGYRKQLAEAERRGCLDALTGLTNRRGIETAMAARREEGIPFCVVMLDLNYFKSVNDSHGHLAGDELLKEFSAELRAQFRQGDLIGRWGGDEFLIVLNGDLSAARDSVDRVRKWAFGTYKVRGPKGMCQVEVSASIGIAAWDRGEDVPHLLSRADEAMYQEKRAKITVLWVPSRHPESVLVLFAGEKLIIRHRVCRYS